MATKGQADDDDAPGQEMGDDTAGATEEAGFQAAFKARESKANGALAQYAPSADLGSVLLTGLRGRHKDALIAALSDPPLGTKSDAIKDQSADLVISIISAVKESDSKGILDALSDDQLDLLMKYIYRGMANADNSAPLLKWHAAVTEKAGLGCIVRVLAERKSVV